MKAEEYHTVKKPGEGLFRDRGSRFIGLAFPVETEEEIKSILDETRKQYHDARHHCFAWRLGVEMESYRSNDDGEPSGSAGKPIFGQIISRDLTNVLVIVVRYFGGTLLGVGGLIHAYRSAASSALDEAGILKKYVHVVYLIKFNYDDMNNVMRILKEFNAEQSAQDFGLSCSVHAKVRKNQAGRFESAFIPYTAIKVKFISEA
jgi:uncharacterized YigZ family protein